MFSLRTGENGSKKFHQYLGGGSGIFLFEIHCFWGTQYSYSISQANTVFVFTSYWFSIRSRRLSKVQAFHEIFFHQVILEVNIFLTVL
uniref:Uncharacterized protein n=1 Tax=Octopus bimaculoides TaxID=37653 RepID=A0A0L8H408_OCTBM